MKNKYPVIDIGENNVNQQFSVYGSHRYSCARLFDLAKSLPVFDCPLAALDLTSMPMKESDMIEVAWHCKKVNDADLSYPIIMFKDGGIADGRHRIIKALMLGKETIKAVRLDHWPEPCRVDKND